MPTYDGMRALVTGGGSGIGAATARLLRDGGAQVACVDLDPAGAPEGCLQLVGDVSDPGVSLVVEQAVSELGGLDVLVNNAGVGAAGTVEDSDDDEFRRLHEVNVLGTVRVTRAALPALRASSSAVVVNTCSVAAQVGLPKRAAYSASKGAVLSLTLAMAADHLADGVRVCAVAPGHRRHAVGAAAARRRRRPGGRAGGAGGPAADRPAGVAGGGGGDHLLPGLAALRVGDRHGRHRGRRAVLPAAAAVRVTRSTRTSR